MKRLIALFWCVISFVCVSHAQSKTYLGVQSGASFGTANIYSALDILQIEAGVTSGYQFGVTLMHFTEHHIGVQTGLNFIQKGWEQNFSPETNVAAHESRFDYLELPMLVHVYTGKERFHFFFNGGCFLEYMIDYDVDPIPVEAVPARDLLSGTDRELPYQIPYAVGSGSDNFVPFDSDRDRLFGYGFKGGLGAYYDFDFGTLMLEVNGSYSISDVFDAGDFSEGVPTASKKINAGIVVGYLFSFGKLKDKEED